MSSQNYFKFLLIVIVLSNLLFLRVSSPALAQQGAGAEEENLKQVKILIDNFEAVAAIPKEFKYLEKGGPSMLRTALTKATPTEKLLRFIFVERRKLNAILQEGGGIQRKLSEVFDQSKVKERLKGEGAEYVIFVSYFVLSGNRVRADARIVQVEEVAAEISEFHVFGADDPDPLQPLADKLVKTYLDKVMNRKSVSPQSFRLCILGFDYDGPEHWEKTKEIIPQRLTALLLMSKMKKMRFVSADNLVGNQGKNLSHLVVMNPRIDYFIIGRITIIELDKETMALVNIRHVDRKGVILTCTETTCEPTELMIGKDILEKLVEELKNDWPNIIKKRDTQ